MVPGTLEPDAISLYREEEGDTLYFIISDAKYYHFEIKKDKKDNEKDKNKIQGQPGIADITKQYLYELAYKKMIDSINKDHSPTFKIEVRNCFISPTENTEIEELAVKLSMFLDEPLELSVVQTFLFPASEIYDLYLRDSSLKLQTMWKKLFKVENESID